MKEDAEIALCRAQADDEEGPRYAPWDPDEKQPVCELSVKVIHKTEGVLRVNKFIDLPSGPGDKLGNSGAKTFAALGISEDQIENGFDETKLEGKKVVVEVSHSTSKKTNITHANIKSVVLKQVK